MIEIGHARLRVQVLHPVEDRDRLGSRYCAGGYIRQATHAAHGAWFAGPASPAPRPPPFDGEGAPEVFERALGAGTARVGDDVCVPGVGLVLRTSPREPFHVRDNPVVREAAEWDLHVEPETVRMECIQSYAQWSFRIVRRVSLCGDELVSATLVENRGPGILPVRWFAHPFLPRAADGGGARFDPAPRIPDSPAFQDAGREGLSLRAGYPWERGSVLDLELTDRRPLRVECPHPAAGRLGAACDFAPDELRVWANARAFSFEPFRLVDLPPGQTAEWSIAYRPAGGGE